MNSTNWYQLLRKSFNNTGSTVGANTWKVQKKFKLKWKEFMNRPLFIEFSWIHKDGKSDPINCDANLFFRNDQLSNSWKHGPFLWESQLSSKNWFGPHLSIEKDIPFLINDEGHVLNRGAKYFWWEEFPSLIQDHEYSLGAVITNTPNKSDFYQMRARAFVLGELVYEVNSNEFCEGEFWELVKIKYNPLKGIFLSNPKEEIEQYNN